ncbi:hypothetical protein GCM10022396_03190 [Flavivirga amylovorans]
MFLYINHNLPSDPIKITNPNHKDFLNLNGHVKSIKTNMYDIEEGKEELYEKEIITFNIKGFKIDESSYNADGSIDYTIKYAYDDHNNLIEKRQYSPEDNDIETEKYLYDKSNNLIEEKNYENEKLDSKIVYEYDTHGNRVKKTNFDSKNRKRSYELYLYDANGNRVGEQHYNSGKLKTKAVYKFDKNNDKVQQLRYNSKNELEFKTFYAYDDAHKLIEVKSYYGVRNNNKFAKKNTFVYNSQGKKSEVLKYNADDVAIERTDFKYNENQDITFINRFGSNGSLLKSNESSYTLDEKNNWTKLTDYLNREKYRVWVRDIEYFDE